jgi:uncharacterized coiled-coil DUF342 family protein
MSNIIEDRGRGFLIEIGEELSRLHAENSALKAEVAAMQKQRDDADAECREANASWCREIEESIDLNRELASMREQRDEARREICELRADLRVNPTCKRQVADERGWDCFKEKDK